MVQCDVEFFQVWWPQQTFYPLPGWWWTHCSGSNAHDVHQNSNKWLALHTLSASDDTLNWETWYPRVETARRRTRPTRCSPAPTRPTSCGFLRCHKWTFWLRQSWSSSLADERHWWFLGVVCCSALLTTTLQLEWHSAHALFCSRTDMAALALFGFCGH